MKFDTTSELADAICTLIDDFGEYRLGELELYHYLKHIRLKNETLLYEGNEYKSEVVSIVGSKRLELMEDLLAGQYMS